MATLVQDNPELDRYEVFEDGESWPASRSTPRSDTAIVLNHTEVDDRFEGAGIGSALARGVLDAARRRDRPCCPTARSWRGYIRNHPDDYPDLVPDDRRATFV